MGEIQEYGNLRKANPHDLLKYFSGNSQSGCLRLFSNSMAWAVYLEQGKITYATHSVAPSDRLACHLRRLSYRTEVKVGAIEQLRRILEFIESKNHSSQPPEYRAIDSLVLQKYLTNSQASVLVEGLTKEAIVSLLLITGVTYEFKCGLDTLPLPKFCELALSPTLEHCQKQLQDWQDSLYGPEPPYNQLPKIIAHSLKVDKSVDVTVASTPTATFSGKQQQVTSNQTYTVACVDDSPTILSKIKQYLSEENLLKPELINDPVKALMQIIKVKPDLILLDIGMPRLDGYELCRLLRNHSRFKKTPIIMVTGSTGIVDRVKAKLVGASGYLTKPFDEADLLKTVFRHLH